MSTVAESWLSRTLIWLTTILSRMPSGNCFRFFMLSFWSLRELPPGLTDKTGEIWFIYTSDGRSSSCMDCGWDRSWRYHDWPFAYRLTMAFRSPEDDRKAIWVEAPRFGNLLILSSAVLDIILYLPPWCLASALKSLESSEVWTSVNLYFLSTYCMRLSRSQPSLKSGEARCINPLNSFYRRLLCTLS